MRELQLRLKAVGMSQERLAEILGHAPITVSEYVNGKANPGARRHIVAIVTALELMTVEQRARWEMALDLDPAQPRPAKRPKRAGGGHRI